MRSEEELLTIQNKLLGILNTKNQSLYEKFNDSVLKFEPALFPINPRTEYNHYNSYNLELGCGWGEFAREYSKRNPDEFYLAIDKKRYRISKSLSLQKVNPISNLKWMVGNFSWFFNGLFAPETFNKIIINFPDPWPKKRHLKHRFITSDLIEELNKILVKKGIIEFATDSWNYMENALFDFNSSCLFKNKNGKNVILNEIKGRPKSFFEELKREEKENIYIIELEKVSQDKNRK